MDGEKTSLEVVSNLFCDLLPMHIGVNFGKIAKGKGIVELHVLQCLFFIVMENIDLPFYYGKFR
jgi:hypothetical protein